MSTASKAPASKTTTASKAPKASDSAKKTGSAKPPADGEKKKRRKSRKETYSSYIYKGKLPYSFSYPNIALIL